MKKDFPILKNVSYLDNAATTQKPIRVINRIKKFYEKENSNVHRGIYSLSEEATKTFEDSRKVIADFINASPEELVFVHNATDGLNHLARAYKGEVLVTEMEHHSNFVPWQVRSENFRVVPLDELDSISDYVTEKTRVVSVTHMSNVSGKIMDVKSVVQSVKKKNPDVIVIVDGCQAIAHMDVDVKDSGVDYYVFSGHKVYGPTGIGVIYGKKELLKKIKPFNYGGGMINEVLNDETTYAELPNKFEAGTQNIAGVIGLAEAVKYLKKGFEEKKSGEEELQGYLVDELKKINNLEIIGHDDELYGPVVSFNIRGLHPHDVAEFCNKNSVCIRAGHHCSQPFMNALGITATCRVSLSFYNDEEDVDKLIKSLKEAQRVINGHV